MYKQINIPKRNQLVRICETIKILKDYKPKFEELDQNFEKVPVKIDKNKKEKIIQIVYSLRDIIQEDYYHNQPTKRKNFKRLSLLEMSEILNIEIETIKDKSEKDKLAVAYYYIELLRLYFDGLEAIYRSVKELEDKTGIHVYTMGVDVNAPTPAPVDNIELDELY